MSQENQISVPAAPVQNVPAKRKRGRPRKDESLGGIPRRPAPKTPKPAPVKKIPETNNIDPISNGVDTMLGQAVSGVLDGSFDAGYLVTVKVGNTNTVLRGVVFNPGLVVPISEVNDVASNVKMFKKREILSNTTGYQKPLNPIPLSSMPPVPQACDVTHMPLKAVPIDMNQAPQASPQASRQADTRPIFTQSHVMPESWHHVVVPVPGPNQNVDGVLKPQPVDLNDPPVDFVTAGALGDLIMKDKAYQGTECASTKMIAELSKIWGKGHIQPNINGDVDSVYPTQVEEGSCLNGRVSNAVVLESLPNPSTADSEIQNAANDKNLTSL
ncbi:hypothetical protein ACHQM5_016974 [Ranunculus cassubicifolius]